MKKILIAVSLFASVIASYAQGTVAFNNSALTRVTVDGVNATSAQGLNIGLFYGTSADSLTLLTDFGAIGGTAGVFAAASGNGSLLALPGVAGGATVFLQVRAWQSSFGNNWQAAQTAFNGQVTGTIYGQTAVIQTVAGASSGPGTVIWQTASQNAADKFKPLQAFTAIPEPSTFALGALGIGALLMVRRRKA